MSGEAEKVTSQELVPAPPTSSTDVGETAKLADISSVADGDVDIKATGDNDKAGQVTPAASAGPVEPLIAAASSTAPVQAPSLESLTDPETSEGQPKAGANGTTKDDVTVTDKVEEDAKTNQAAHTPVVGANGHARNEDVEMGAARTAPENATTAKAGANIPPLAGGKRKAGEAFGDSDGDRGQARMKLEINIRNENEMPTKKPGPGPGRPRKQKDRKILTPVGRTARKTRSQGPV
ncbi:hypothetical protein QBC41DRAFT_325700 [Cercophora samala]|uniref:Uncharacterized protein n=1 Tax=Cercophora samala TaxID=330535 RepID=A0AA40D849_9PEZI|nr:hypothetical protein QBC41DRAFT_325700 [Cercophora samala]